MISPSPTEHPARVLRNVTLEGPPLELRAHPRPQLLNEGERDSNDVHAVTAPAMPLDFDALIEDARQRGYAEGMAVATAADEAARQQVRESGYVEGRAEGLARGAEEARTELTRAKLQAINEAAAQLGEQRDRLEKLLAAVTSQASQLVESAEDELVALVFECVCRLLGEHAAAPETVRNAVSALLAQRTWRGDVTVHLNPDDLACLEFISGDVAGRPWKAVADTRVRLGGAMLSSAQANLDARLELQLEKLAAELLRVRSGRRQSAEAAA